MTGNMNEDVMLLIDTWVPLDGYNGNSSKVIFIPLNIGGTSPQ